MVPKRRQAGYLSMVVSIPVNALRWQGAKAAGLAILPLRYLENKRPTNGESLFLIHIISTYKEDISV